MKSGEILKVKKGLEVLVSLLKISFLCDLLQLSEKNGQ